MPTYGFKLPKEKKVSKGKSKERHRVGPHGEKRPMSETGNAVRIMEIATGLSEEEYVDGTRGRKTKRQ